MVAFAVPQYATSVTFFVTTPGDATGGAYQDSLFSAQRVKSYADLLTGDRLAQAVALNPAINLTAAQIQQRISTRPVPDTVLLQATVTDSDPTRSGLIARELSHDFADLVQTLETPPGSDTPRAKVEVVAGPTTDSTPVSPRPVRSLVFGAIVGLLVGIALAVLRESLDVTIKTADGLREVAGAPVLATVPLDMSARRAPLVMDAEPHSPRAEALRHLRTNLQYVDVDKPVRVVAVTSSSPDEGKTTTTVNLAIAFAKAGRSVLLIEADMRRPRIAEYLGLEGIVGLSNVLAGLVSIEDVVQHWGRNELYVLPSGFSPPNPSELLSSKAMATLVEKQKARFDVILIDTPPLLPVTDAAIVATDADGVLFVCRAGKTSQLAVRTATGSLRAVDARLLGCVLNMHPTKRRDEYYSYAYGRRRGDSKRKVSAARSAAAAAPTSPAHQVGSRR
jgi:capsular exopolysaccharide synthesis family protein